MKKLSLAIIAAPLLVSGCVPLIFAGAGTGAVVAQQDRTPGHAVDDTGIRLAINNQFLQKGDVNDLYRNVTIKVTEGRVLLTGDVDKPETKIKAAELAWNVKGVREVINEIQVNDKTGIMDYAKDSWIANTVRSRFILEKGLHSVNYNVEVVNGVVYLMGIAQDQAELDKATYIASTTSGVQKVVNHAVLRDDPRRKND
ncbi:MAG TPA: BON domain-containing protein [Rickettsiales bacterium]|nr:BON domain-containing protein [Rickettsiales bacterium]